MPESSQSVSPPARKRWFTFRTVIMALLLVALAALVLDWQAKRRAHALHNELLQWLPPYTAEAVGTYFTPASVQSLAGRAPDGDAQPTPQRRHMVFAFRGALHYYTVHAFFEGQTHHLVDSSLTIDQLLPTAGRPEDFPLFAVAGRRRCDEGRTGAVAVGWDKR